VGSLRALETRKGSHWKVASEKEKKTGTLNGERGFLSSQTRGAVI